MNSEERKSIMIELRALNLSDEQIGGVVGLTRERVAQILGRKKEDVEILRARKDAEKAVKSLLPTGINIFEVSNQTNIPVRDLRSAMSRLGLKYSDFAEARRQHKIDLVSAEVRQFMKIHNVPLISTALMRLDRTLYNKMSQLMGIPDWRKHLKVEDRTYGRNN